MDSTTSPDRTRSKIERYLVRQRFFDLGVEWDADGTLSGGALAPALHATGIPEGAE